MLNMIRAEGDVQGRSTSLIGGLIFPSLGFSVGVPVQVRPEVAAGIRLQLTLQWPVIGMGTSFDVYPGLDDEGSRSFQATMLAQGAL